MEIDFNNPPLGLFVYRTETHFDVLDAQWLMHHSRQIRYMERAQQAMFDHLMGAESFDPWKYPDMNVVVRKLEVDFVKGLRGVRPFIITLRPVKLRASALTTLIELRSEGGDEIYTKATRTVCKIGFEKQEPEFWTDEFRKRYIPWVEAAQKLDF